MWFQLAILIISAALSYALRPKPPVPKAATLSDFNIPTPEVGKPLPVVFGDVWVDNADVLWYGDLSTQPIKQSGK